MISTPSILKPFSPLYGPLVASWVRSERELFLLAPSTPFPLTGAKVSAWTRSRGRGFLLLAPCEAMPTGYGELNPMRDDPYHHWLGHLVVDPDRRGQGVGRRLIDALVNWAFAEARAHKLTLVVFPENEAAVRCYQRHGFQLKGEEYQTFRGHQQRHRLLRFELPAPAQLAPTAAASADVAVPTPASA